MKKNDIEYQIDVDHKRIDLRAAKFVFYQAEKLLAALISNTNFLITRGTKSLQIIMIFLLADLGYIIASLNNDYDHYILWAAIMMAIVLAISGYYAFQMMTIAKVREIGSRPSLLFEKEYAEEITNYIKDHQELILILNEIEQYENRIKKNNELNDQRGKFFIYTIRSFGIGLFITLIYLSIIIICGLI